MIRSLQIIPLLPALIFILTGLLATSSAMAQAAGTQEDDSPFITLVSTDGNKIEAEIIAATADSVLIRRKDKQEFRFSPSLLDAKSQQLVKNWIADQAVANSLDIRVRRKRVSLKKTETQSTTGDESVYVLEFIVSNKSAVAINNIIIEYLILVELEDFGPVIKERRMKGKLTFKTIPPRGEVILASEPIPLTQQKVRPNWIISESKKRSIEDKISGHVYRAIYNKSQIATDASPKRLIKDEPF